MIKRFEIRNFTNWIKLFTYISATVLFIVNNSFENLTKIIPAILLIFFINYSRDYLIVLRDRPVAYE